MLTFEFCQLSGWDLSEWRAREKKQTSRGTLVNFRRFCQLLATNAHKMAPRTGKGLQERARDNFVREGPSSGPLFDDLARAKSAKELKEHLETRVL